LRHFGLVGWDLAATDDGPVIVEANESTDMILAQLADRRGFLDAPFVELLARRRRESARHATHMRKAIARL
jgi:hypothetical protein